MLIVCDTNTPNQEVTNLRARASLACNLGYISVPLEPNLAEPNVLLHKALHLPQRSECVLVRGFSEVTDASDVDGGRSPVVFWWDFV